jgi:uncharacterized protein (DUF952 family)
MIFHVTDKESWDKAMLNDSYINPSLELEGFIHMSTRSQVAGVLERYFKNSKNLLLLHVDEQLLKAEIRYELSPSLQEEFPHVYGAINLDAVVNVESLP